VFLIAPLKVRLWTLQESPGCLPWGVSKRIENITAPASVIRCCQLVILFANCGFGHAETMRNFEFQIVEC
jgi:hypothetical protein